MHQDRQSYTHFFADLRPAAHLPLDSVPALTMMALAASSRSTKLKTE